MIRSVSQPRKNSSPTQPTPHHTLVLDLGRQVLGKDDHRGTPGLWQQHSRLDSCSHNALTASLTNTLVALSPCLSLALNRVQPQQRSK